MLLLVYYHRLISNLSGPPNLMLTAITFKRFYLLLIKLCFICLSDSLPSPRRTVTLKPVILKPDATNSAD